MENKVLFGEMAIRQIDYISKMYDIKDELLAHIIDIQFELKEIKRDVEKLKELRRLEKEL